MYKFHETFVISALGILGKVILLRLIFKSRNVSYSHCYKKSLTAMVSITAFMLLCNCFVLGSHPKNLAWNGGPLCLKCEHGVDLWSKTGKFVRDNVIAIKAVTYADNIYVITPR